MPVSVYLHIAYKKVTPFARLPESYKSTANSYKWLEPLDYIALDFQLSSLHSLSYIRLLPVLVVLRTLHTPHSPQQSHYKMRGQPLAALLLGLSTPVFAEPLIDVLVASGAANFATYIQSDPDVLAKYLSGQIQTVFAPSDLVPPPASLARRAPSPADVAKAEIQGSEDLADLKTASGSEPGSVIPTGTDSAGLGGQPQVVTSDTRPANVTNPTRRWASSANLTGPSLLRISSGLGNIANIIHADIPFDHGFVHITDK